MPANLLDHLIPIPDWHVQKWVEHPLAAVLTLGAAAIVAGMRGGRDTVGVEDLPHRAGRDPVANPTSSLVKVMFQGPCKQFSMCDHCRKLENTKYRVWHDMGPSTVGGTEHVDIGPGGFDTPAYYQACRVCDKRIRSGA